MVKPKLSKSFEVTKTSGAVYTGGQVEWVGDVSFTPADGGVNVVRDGSVLSRLEEEEDPVVSFTTSSRPSGDGAEEDRVILVTGHKSGLVRQWDLTDRAKPDLVRTFRSIHVGPISVIRLHHLANGGRVLATGGADGSVKVWDLDHQYYTHNFRTSGNVATVVVFHPTRLVVYGGFTTGGLFSWDLTNSKLLGTMEGHYSSVTGFIVIPDNDGDDRAVSCGRDKVVIVWRLSDHSKVKTVPVFDSIEGLVLVPGAGLVLGSGTRLRLWDADMTRQKKEVDLGSEVVCVRPGSDSAVLHAATADNNLVRVAVAGEMTVEDTVVGNNDEILDVAYLGPGRGSHLAVACNSPAVRLYAVEDGWRCRLCPGHADTVMCLAVCRTDPGLLATGSKDKEVRLWRLENDSLTCLVVASGHTAALGGLAFSQESSSFLVSVSKDTTVKMWAVDLEKRDMTSVRTEVGHEKDINCVAVAPGDGLVATGSQDRLVKLWSGADLRLVAALRGHKRGVWCCRFSPVDRLVASGGADAAIRIWSLADHSCVKQLEGHDTSVLRLDWVGGTQLCSSSSAGLVKVWWVARQECVATLDQEQDKIWALAVSGTTEAGDLRITAGSADGRLVSWADVTESAEAAGQADKDKLVVQHQKLSNLLAAGEFGKALRLALRLSQPFTCLKIVKQLEYEQLKAAVLSLNNPSLDQLLTYTVKWNSNSRHSSAAQSVLHVVLTNVDSEVLLALPTATSSGGWLEGLVPYTDKHFDRLSRLQVKIKIVDYLRGQMKETTNSLNLSVAPAEP